MQEAYYFVLVLLAVTALVCVGFAIQAIRNPRRVWDRQHGRDVKNGEPTEESLVKIRRNAWIGLFLVPTIFPLFAFVLSLKFERDEKELSRFRDQQQERERNTPKTAPGDDVRRGSPTAPLSATAGLPASHETQETFGRPRGSVGDRPQHEAVPAAATVRLERVGQLAVIGDNPFLSLAVQGKYAYLIQGNVEKPKRLQVVDLADPTQPRIVGSCPVAVEAGALAVADDYVYVLDEPNFRVLDVSDPAAPRDVGSCELGTLLWDLVIQGRYAYVTDVESVRVIDLENPTAPKQVGRCEVETAQGIAVAGQHAYVACDIEGLAIVDISNPTAPSPVGRFDKPQGAAAVAVVGNYAYIAGGEDAVTLWIADISDPKKPKSVGKYGDWIVGSVAVQGDLAFIAGGELDIVDISNPAAPKQAGSHRDVEFVTVAGENVFVVGGEGFSILRVVTNERRE